MWKRAGFKVVYMGSKGVLKGVFSGLEVYSGGGGAVAILNNTLFRAIFEPFLWAVGGVAVE